MFWSRELLDKVDRLLDMVEGDGRAVAVLERRLEQVEAQNSQLFDRLMSIDWEKYAMLKPETGEAYMTPERGMDEDEDEANAGEILEIE